MKRALDHLLIALWVEEREGESRDAELHGQEALTPENRAALLAEAENAGCAVCRDGEWRLTEEGERIARALVRRHRLAERLFSDVLELPEAEFELSACRFEHMLSERAADRICTLLAHPTTCPHGRPVPPGDCCHVRSRAVEPIVERLPDLSAGDEAFVVFVTPTATSRLEKLGALGISAGSMVRLVQRRPSFVIEAGETEVALEESVGRDIFVSRVAAAPRDERARRGVCASVQRGLGIVRGTLGGLLGSLVIAAAAFAAVGARSLTLVIVSLSLLAAGAALPARVSAQEFLTKEQAVERIFGSYDELIARECPVSDAQRSLIEQQAGCAVAEQSLTFLMARRAGEPLGWVYVGDVAGLYEPITFAVGIGAAGQVKDVEILVYRESRGGEVRRRRFLNQYRGKDADSRLKLHDDVLNITGATVSSRAVTYGVKKALVAFRALDVAAAKDAALSSE
jgi:DtxR family Mn-dependent transcriptional regulator